MKDFSGLHLVRPILKAIEAEGYATPTPIQAQSIPLLMKGRDLLGVAQTGTGKTAAFTLPILHRLAAHKEKPHKRTARALILAPTRELAGQIADCVRTYGKFLQLRSAAVFGGAPILPQIKRLSQGVDVLVATPGRLLDLMNQKHLSLEHVEVFVLDEADRMLDMGFIHDVKKISDALSGSHQTVLFSATMPRSVQNLANSLLKNPARVEVAPAATTAERVEQRVLFVTKENKRDLLLDVLANEELKRVLIFTRTKYGADRVAKILEREGIRSAAIHGNKTQGARQKALDMFKNGKLRVLVATDIASRGIDVDDVTHVINFEIPNEPETYVHRIGRTARGGAEGMAVSFCDADERAYLDEIERTIGERIPWVVDHEFHNEKIANDFQAQRPKKSSGGKKRPAGAKRSKPMPKGEPKGEARGKPKGDAAANPKKIKKKRPGRRERMAKKAAAASNPE